MVFTPDSISWMQSPLSFSIIFRQRTPSSHWYPPTLKTGWMAVIDIKRNTRTDIILIPTVPARDIRSLSVKKKRSPSFLPPHIVFQCDSLLSMSSTHTWEAQENVLLVDCTCQVLGWPRSAFRFSCYIIWKTRMNMVGQPNPSQERWRLSTKSYRWCEI